MSWFLFPLSFHFTFSIIFTWKTSRLTCNNTKEADYFLYAFLILQLKKESLTEEIAIFIEKLDFLHLAGEAKE
jgi:hypothetical protein